MPMLIPSTMLFSFVVFVFLLFIPGINSTCENVIATDRNGTCDDTKVSEQVFAINV